MSPAQPEVHRSGRTPLDPDHADTQVEVEHRAPRDEPGGGPIPEDNRPGHHPDHEQDKPDLDDFAAKFGTSAHDEGEGPTATGDDRAEPGRDRDESRVDSAMDRGRSAVETATTIVSGGIAAGAAVAGPAFSALRGVADRMLEKKRRHDQGRPGDERDADRIARLESRVADLERQLRDR